MNEDFNKYFENDIQRVRVNNQRVYNCPNCGAAIETEQCPYCGTVFVDFGCLDTDKPFFLKIKDKDEKIKIFKVILDSINYEHDYTELYADNHRFIHAIPISTLNISFQVIH